MRYLPLWCHHCWESTRHHQVPFGSRTWTCWYCYQGTLFPVTKVLYSLLPRYSIVFSVNVQYFMLPRHIILCQDTEFFVTKVYSTVFSVIKVRYLLLQGTVFLVKVQYYLLLRYSILSIEVQSSPFWLKATNLP
jgi:hypothetical protein